MLEVVQEIGFRMGVRRSQIRLHLPLEIRHAHGVNDWDRAEKDIYDLLEKVREIGVQRLTMNQIIEMEACANLALARESVEADEPVRAFNYLRPSTDSSLYILMKRAFWGPGMRAIIKTGIR